jgi:hypothetical protein
MHRLLAIITRTSQACKVSTPWASGVLYLAGTQTHTKGIANEKTCLPMFANEKTCLLKPTQTALLNVLNRVCPLVAATLQGLPIRAGIKGACPGSKVKRDVGVAGLA